MEEWLSTEQASKSLAVSQSRIRAMVNDGLLTGEKRGRDLFISALSVSTQRSTYGQLSTAMRIRVFVRDSLTCQECGLYEDDPSRFHVHHKIERSNGGTNDIDNLETLCCECHRARHSTTGQSDGTKPCTYRFKEDVIRAIEDLVRGGYGRDKTEAVSRAIMEARERLGGTELLSGQTAQVSTGPSTPADAPFHPTCRHCGQNFGAWNRNAALCPDCKAARHIGEPRDCSACQDRGTGAL